MELLLQCLLFCLVQGQLNFYKIPKLTTCRRSDSDYNRCLKFAIQNALNVIDKEKRFLNFPSVQPLEVPQWFVEAGRVLSFDQKYSEIELYNHARCKVDDVKLSLSDGVFTLRFYFYNPETIFKAKYQYNEAAFMGMVLKDTGNLTFTEKGYSGIITIQGDIVGEHGLRYISIRDVQLKRDEPISVSYAFETGDNKHDDKAKKLFEENIDAIYNDVGEEFKNMYQFGYYNIIDAFFSTVPFDKLFPN